MSKTQYDLVWKEGSWLEKGHWRLVPKSNNDSGAALVGWLIALAIILFIVAFLILISPMIAIYFAFQMVREKRFIAGIIGVIAFSYFYYDISNDNLSGLLFSGYTNSDGKFTEGLFKAKYIKWIMIGNFIAVGLSIGFIIDSILVSQYGKKYDDDRVTTPQVVIYLVPMLLCFLLSFTMNVEKQSIMNTPAEEVKPAVEDNSYAVVDTTTTYPSENEIIADTSSVNYNNNDSEYENSKSYSEKENNTSSGILNDYSKTILFENGSYQISITSENILNSMIQIMNNYEDSKFDIIGYSNEHECNGCNLSKDRANSIKNYLTYHGIDENRLFVKYFPANDLENKEVIIRLRK